jgi:hypothetical protein
MSHTLSAEQEQTLDRFNAAIQADDWDTAMELGKHLPVPPELAQCFEQVFGSGYLKNLGFNRLDLEANDAKA